jgi:hypothetical protein
MDHPPKSVLSEINQLTFDLVCEEPASLVGGTVGGYPAPAASSRRHQADMDGDIDQNREFYRGQDVRPPYTYAALIRQVTGKESESTVKFLN